MFTAIRDTILGLLIIAGMLIMNAIPLIVPVAIVLWLFDVI